MTMKTIRLQETTERQSWMHDSVDKQQDQRALGVIHPLKILVISDSTFSQGVIVRSLHRLAYQAQGVTQEEFLQAVRQNKYDVILLDLPCLRTALTDIVNYMRGLFSAASQPHIVTLISASVVLPSLHKIDGVDAVLRKPLKMTQLGRALSNFRPLHIDINSDWPPVNLSIIQNLSGVEDKALLQELVELYLKGAQKDMELLTSTRNRRKIEMAAHSIKGASSCIGARRLATLCNELENEVVKCRSVDELESILSQVTNEFATVQRYLQQKVIL